MCVVDRRRHQVRRFVAGEAEHQALVAGALFFGLLAVDAHVDVGRLLADEVQHAAGVAVVADIGIVIADAGDDLAGDAFDIRPGSGGDFAGDDGDTGLDQCFAGDTRALVLREDRVKDRVGNLVGESCPGDLRTRIRK